MKNPDHISESLETIFGIKYLNSLMRIQDPGKEKIGTGIRDGKNSDPGQSSRIRNTSRMYGKRIIMVC
jgi:hypothetical protein